MAGKEINFFIGSGIESALIFEQINIVIFFIQEMILPENRTYYYVMTKTDYSGQPYCTNGIFSEGGIRHFRGS